MYIWTAVNVDSQLASIKKKAMEIEKEIKFEQSDISRLPLHVSLKISCFVEDGKYDEVVNDLTGIFKTYRPFTITPKTIELHETISWLHMESNEYLEKLHGEMCSLFVNKYGTTLDRYDNEFVYHSTLFLDPDTDKVKAAFLKIKDEPVPEVLRADRFVIGGSPDGKINTYRVFKEIEI